MQSLGGIAHLLAVANQLGVSEEDARAAGSDAALQNSLYLVHQAQINAARAAQPKDEEGATDNAPKEFDPDLDPEEYDPAYIKAIKGVAAHAQEKIDALSKTVDELRGATSRSERQMNERVADEFENRFDGFIKEKSELKSILGEGRGVDLDKESQHFKNRIAVLNQMGIMAAGYRAAKKSVPQESTLFEKAVRAEFGGQSDGSSERSKISKTLERRGKLIQQRPAGGKPSSGKTNPEADARAWVGEYLESQGIA